MAHRTALVELAILFVICFCTLCCAFGKEYNLTVRTGTPPPDEHINVTVGSNITIVCKLRHDYESGVRLCKNRSPLLHLNYREKQTKPDVYYSRLITTHFSYNIYRINLIDIQPTDEGAWPCFAYGTRSKSLVLTVLSAEYNLTVQKGTPPPDEHINVTVGSNITIVCKLRHDYESGVRLCKNRSPLLHLNYREKQTKPDVYYSRLITTHFSYNIYRINLIDIQPTDEGAWSCSAYGTRSKSLVLTVLSAETTTIFPTSSSTTKTATYSVQHSTSFSSTNSAETEDIFKREDPFVDKGNNYVIYVGGAAGVLLLILITIVAVVLRVKKKPHVHSDENDLAPDGRENGQPSDQHLEYDVDPEGMYAQVGETSKDAIPKDGTSRKGGDEDGMVMESNPMYESYNEEAGCKHKSESAASPNETGDVYSVVQKPSKENLNQTETMKPDDGAGDVYSVVQKPSKGQK